MDKRRKPRQQRRLSCELWLEGKRHTGILRDASPVGLFVQTRAKAKPGVEIALVFAAAGARPEVRVRTRVARQEHLAAALASTGTGGGLGLQVLEAVPGLEALLEGEGFSLGARRGVPARKRP